MGDRLKVDLDQLADTAHALRRLASEFKNASNIADSARRAVGHEKVNSALSEFADNWRSHRRGLEKSIDAVASMAEDSLSTYESTDSDLSRQLR